MSASERRRFGIDLDEIDAYLGSLAGVADDAELRARFTTYRAEHSTAATDDPFSPAYRRHVLDMYEHLAGREYAPANEVTTFDMAWAMLRPFPYSTGSARVVADHLMLVGHCMRMFESLAPGASVLDCGAGWGNTTLALAKAGFRVSALEVDDQFAELLAARAEREQVGLEVLHGDYLSVIERLAAEGRRFDAVLFFESFHHCDDPDRLVSMLGSVVAPGGLVVFASEPVFDDFPVPWGLRLDGESLWAIRSNGWLELGFQPEFFTRMLARHGWVAYRRSLVPGVPSGFAYVAQRTEETAVRWTMSTGLLSQVGMRDGRGVITEGRAGFLVFGPYAPLAPGAWRFSVEVDAAAVAPSGTVVVTVSCELSSYVFARQTVDAAAVLAGGTTTIVIDADIDRDVADLEVQVRVTGDTHLCVIGVSGVRVGDATGGRKPNPRITTMRANAFAAARRARRRLPHHPLVDRAVSAVARRVYPTQL